MKPFLNLIFTLLVCNCYIAQIETQYYEIPRKYKTFQTIETNKGYLTLVYKHSLLTDEPKPLVDKDKGVVAFNFNTDLRFISKTEHSADWKQPDGTTRLDTVVNYRGEPLILLTSYKQLKQNLYAISEPNFGNEPKLILENSWGYKFSKPKNEEYFLLSVLSGNFKEIFIEMFDKNINKITSFSVDLSSNKGKFRIDDFLVLDNKKVLVSVAHSKTVYSEEEFGFYMVDLVTQDFIELAIPTPSSIRITSAKSIDNDNTINMSLVYTKESNGMSSGLIDLSFSKSDYHLISSNIFKFPTELNETISSKKFTKNSNRFLSYTRVAEYEENSGRVLVLNQNKAYKTYTHTSTANNVQPTVTTTGSSFFSNYIILKTIGTDLVYSTSILSSDFNEFGKYSNLVHFHTVKLNDSLELYFVEKTKNIIFCVTVDIDGNKVTRLIDQKPANDKLEVSNSAKGIISVINNNRLQLYKIE